MKKNIYLKAYTKVNLGDDLFIDVICNRYINTNFHIYADKIYKKIFKDIPNLKIYSFGYKFVEYIGKILHKLGKRNFVREFIQGKLIEKCDAIAIIGGSLFIQKGLTAKRTKIKLEEEQQILQYEKPIFLLGSNFRTL